MLSYNTSSVSTQAIRTFVINTFILQMTFSRFTPWHGDEGFSRIIKKSRQEK